MRPTGKLHLGNYMGALRNWVRLQNELDENGQPKYDCFFFIADLHALTTDYADPSQLQQNTLDVALDWLAARLDPQKSTIFVQSHVPAHSELHVLFSMITPLGWLERVPSYKDQQENITGKDLTTYGFLGYPLLQAADILIYGSPGVPLFVPVGADQVAHVELTREVARRFNHLYPKDMFSEGHDFSRAEKPPSQKGDLAPEGIFPEPDVLLTPSPKLPGTDGRKMSKSYGNTIALDEPEADIRSKLKTMVTDPARKRRSDPGNPEICPVGDLHKVFSSQEVITKVWEGCQTAGIGCIECKGWLADAVLAELAPMRATRERYRANNYALVKPILGDGAARANVIATKTLQIAKQACGLMPPEKRA
jgi:tryptophanyl-tRNA synthetase